MPESKPSPAPSLARLAPGTLVETIDGPVAAIKLVGKATPVLTRFRNGTLGFRMMREVREITPEGALVQLTNTDGQAVLLGRDQVLVRAGGQRTRASEIRAGDALEPGWTYPAGYEVPDESEYDPSVRGGPFQRGVRIAAIEPAGEGPLIACSVNETRSFFLTFGALCLAQR